MTSNGSTRHDVGTPEATFTVTTADDVVDAADGVLSLREAVEQANAAPGADAIGFAADLAGATLVLEQANGGLAVTDDLTIDGDPNDGGPGGVTIAIVDVGSTNLLEGFKVDNASFSLEDATLVGRGSYLAFYGIRAKASDVALTRSTIDEITAYNAGNVRTEGGSLLIEDSTLRMGGLPDAGSNIYAVGTDITIDNSRIDVGNGELSFPGLFAGAGTTVRISNSEFTGTARDTNSGIYGVEGSRIEISDTSIFDTGGETSGNAISTAGYLKLTNSMIANTEVGEGDQAALIVRDGGRAEITNTTITHSIDVLDTGALYVAEGASAILRNNIIVRNEGFDDDVPTSVAGDGSIVSGGGNIFDDTFMPIATSDDLTGVDVTDVFESFSPARTFDGSIILAPTLADNSGPTPTIALVDDAANPAVGFADPATAPATDQRGFARDDAPDAGSFEAGATSGGPVDGGGNDALTVTFVAEDAAFENTLGYYVREDDGSIGEAGVLFANVDGQDRGGGPLFGGEGATLDGGVDADDLGFFLIRDGANEGLDLTGEVVIENGRLSVGDEAVRPWKVFYTDVDLNRDGIEHAITSIAPDGTVTYAWEDKNGDEGSFDGDFDDAVFDVGFDPVNRFGTGTDDDLMM